MVPPGGNAAIAVASLELKTGAFRAMGAPIAADSSLHSFVVLSAGFQKEGPPAHVVVFSGSLQMQLSPNSMHRCSSAWALAAQRSDDAASTMAWVSRWVVIGRSNIGAPSHCAPPGVRSEAKLTIRPDAERAAWLLSGL